MQGFARRSNHDPNKGRTKVRCLNDRLTKKMNAMIQSIIGRCEGENGVRVVSMESEFMLDENDKLWFVRTSSVHTTESEKIAVKLDNDTAHHLRTKKAPMLESQLEHEAQKARRSSLALAEGYKDMKSGGIAGSRSENRIIRRNQLAKGPDEELVSLIMREDDAAEAKRKKEENQAAKDELKRRTSISEMHKSSSMQNLNSNLLKSESDASVESGADHLGASVPDSATRRPAGSPKKRGATHKRNRKKKFGGGGGDSALARTQREIDTVAHSAPAAQTLGSTQLTGCPGDFCSVHISIDKGLDGVMKSYDHLSDFRRKLLEKENEELEWQSKVGH